MCIETLLSTQVVGTPGWVPPEVQTYGVHSKESDVYQLALVCGAVCACDTLDNTLQANASDNGQRVQTLLQNAGVQSEVLNVIAHALGLNLRGRPTASALAAVFKQAFATKPAPPAPPVPAQAGPCVDAALLKMLREFEIEPLSPTLAAKGLTSTKRLQMMLEREKAEDLAKRYGMNDGDTLDFCAMCAKLTQVNAPSLPPQPCSLSSSNLAS